MRNTIFLFVALFSGIIFFSQCKNQEKKAKGTILKMETSMGDMTIMLYDETLKHKENFLKLANEGYFNGMLFHRVIKDFMIQAGDPDSKTAKKGQALGSGGPGYTIEAEFNFKFIHKKGALSAARTGDQMNPEKRSSGSQFYIVQGKTYTDKEMSMMEEQSKMNQLMPFIREYLQNPENESMSKQIQERQNARDREGLDSLVLVITEIVSKQHPDVKVIKYTEEQRELYKTVGGTPHLDGGYTVFGEVLEGLEIVDKIAGVSTGKGDRPIEDVKIISLTAVK
ncbi:MAG: peptidylprolyl isomerase [Bacteroidota bacterium]